MNPVLGPNSQPYPGFSECFLTSRSDHYVPSPGQAAPTGTPFLIDLHADTLLWGREFVTGDSRGHVDLPRLCAGGYGLQVFTIVTKYSLASDNKLKPASSLAAKELPDRCHSSSGFDLVTPMAIAHLSKKHWGLSAVTQLRSRAIAQINTFDDYVTNSQDASQQLVAIRTHNDLGRVAAGFRDRTMDRCVVGGLLGVEGLHFLDAEAPVEEMAFLYRRGLRIASLTHHFDNPLAGASTGCDGCKGLEPLGEQVLRFMLDNGIVLDLAHASSKTIKEVVKFKARYEMEHNKPQIPFFVSHTGIKYKECIKGIEYECQYDRNMTQTDIENVASSGGVIGVMYEPKALCCPECGHKELLNKIVFTYSILYQFLSKCYEKAICKRDGIWPDSPIDHIALGSDFDGAIPSPVDSSTAYMVLGKLRESDFISGQNAVSGAEVALRKISGYNACKVIAHVLPQEQPEYGQTKALTIPDICEDLYGILKPKQSLSANVSD